MLPKYSQSILNSSAPFPAKINTTSKPSLITYIPINMLVLLLIRWFVGIYLPKVSNKLNSSTTITEFQSWSKNDSFCSNMYPGNIERLYVCKITICTKQNQAYYPVLTIIFTDILLLYFYYYLPLSPPLSLSLL